MAIRGAVRASMKLSRSAYVSSRRRRVLGASRLGQLSIAAAVAAFPAFAHAQTTNWTNGSANASWSDPGDWSNGVPSNGYTVNITTATNGTSVNYDFAGGANITLGNLMLSVSTPATGSTTNLLTIPGNSLNAASVFVGDSSPSVGSGTISQSGGSFVVNSLLHLGFGANDKGAFTLSGTGVLTAIGGENIGASGTGLFVQSAGSNLVGGKFNSVLNIGENISSTGTYVLSGTGTLSFDGDGVGGVGEILGNQGTGVFNQSGGLNNVTSNTTSGDTLVLGDFTSGVGTYNLSAGTLNVTGLSAGEAIGVGGKGTFNQTGGLNNLTGSAALMRIQSTTGVSIYNQSGGTMSISGTGVALQINTSGSYSLSGTGVLGVSGTGANEVFGLTTNGSMNQTGGTNTVGGSGSYIAIGEPGAAGSYAISGGTATASGNVYLGGNATGTGGGTGTLTVSGTGVFNVGGTLVVYNSTGSGATLAGGTINTAALNLNGLISALNWSSGTLGLTAGVTFDPLAPTTSTSRAFGSSLSLGGSQQLNVTGNETLGGAGTFTLAMSAGSVDTDTGTFTVNAGSTLSMSAATLAVVGSLSDSGITTLGGIVTSTTGQTYNATVKMTGPTVMLSDTGGAISFGTTISGPNTALTVNGAGGNVFNGIVTAKSLSASGAGGTTLGADVTTTAGQTYGDAVTLTGLTQTLTDATGAVTFSSTVTGTLTALTASGVGGNIFDGAVKVLSLDATGSGGTTLGGNVTTTAGQTYADAVSLTGAAQTVTDADGIILFDSTVTGAGAALTASGAGGNVFDGNVIVQSLSASGAGGTTLGGGVTTTAGQTYSDAVTLTGAAQTLADSAGAVSFSSTLSGPGTALTVSAAGGVSFGGAATLSSLSIQTGTATLAASATISTASESVGGAAGGAFNQTVGANTIVGGELDIAPTGSGRYVLSGGTLTTPSIYFGGTSSGAGGTGVFTINNSGKLSLPGTLKVWNSGRANLDVPTTNVGGVAIVGNGTVNLNGTLNINYGSPANDPVATIVGYLKNGYNGGAWNGTSGIVSTSVTGGSPPTALGYADGNTDSGTAAGPNQIVVKYTLAADANLDGLVNFNDLVAVVQNFNKSGTDWAHGNFHYAGSTSFNDLVLVVQNFNKTLPPPTGTSFELGGTTIPLGQSGQVQGTAVELPEPVAGGLMISAAGLLARRRRRTKCVPRMAG